MPNKERNPNRIRRQPTPDSPPPCDQGGRELDRIQRDGDLFAALA